MRKKALKIHPKDNVIVALDHLTEGEKVAWEGQTYTVQHDIPAKHKFVTEDIAEGGKVYMYGVLVGVATQPIAQGAAITVSNLKHSADDFSL